MNRLLLQQRIVEQTPLVGKASERMLERIATVKQRETLMKCFDIFYPANMKKTIDEIEGLREQLDGKSFEDLQKFCLEICNEGINMDFCTYVSTGKKLGLGQKMYDSLKE